LLQDEVEQHSHEADDLRAQLAGVVKETTDVKTSIRKGAEASSKNTLERAQAEVQRVRLDMEELEDERFELRRALEAHVGALVEAKVDNAEYQGTILELRKELSRVKVKYQRAAARCTKLEAMYYTLKDARDSGAVIEVTAKAAGS
jgi:chromosome segregation ATPase